MTDRTGLFVGWYDVDPDFMPEFNQWHSGEHMPERYRLPGFVSAQRYRSLSRENAYCVLYRAETPEVFVSEPYLAVLNNPTPWTREMAPGFQNFSRGACELVTTSGDGYGGFALLMRFETGASASDLSAATLEALDHFVTTLPGLEGITAAHFGFCRPEITDVDTAEKQTRAGTDEQRFQSVLLVEGYDVALLVQHFGAIEANLDALGMPAKKARYGIYALSHLLTERTTEEPNRH